MTGSPTATSTRSPFGVILLPLIVTSTTVVSSSAADGLGVGLLAGSLGGLTGADDSGVGIGSAVVAAGSPLQPDSNNIAMTAAAALMRIDLPRSPCSLGWRRLSSGADPCLGCGLVNFRGGVSAPSSQSP